MFPKEAPAPSAVLRGLRVYAAMGILEALAGILVGRPGSLVPPEQFDKYDRIACQVIRDEEGLPDLSVATHMDFGHTDPMFVLPYGVQAQIDYEAEQFAMIENAVVD